MKCLKRFSNIQVFAKFCALFFLAWQHCFPAHAEKQNAIPSYAKPTPDEQKFFDTKLQDLRAHDALIPSERRVDDMISTFDTELIRKMVCPNDGRRVRVTINSELSHWDPKIVKTQLPGRQDIVGSCIANYSFRASDQGKINIDFNFHVMLDTATTIAREQNLPMGEWMNESLVYHELLHCELLIKAIKSSPSWTEKVCQNEVDLAPLDSDHVTIYPWIEDFLESLAEITDGVWAHRVLPQDVEADGNFVLDLGKISDFVGKKKRVYSYFMLPASSNIEFQSNSKPSLPRFEYPKNRRIHFRGKLVDPSKAGFVLIKVVPVP